MKENKFYQIFYKSNIIQPLKGFCTAVEEGCSLTKAGKKLCLSTTAIFKQIRSLEEKLNTKLFNKTSNRKDGNRLELTKEGQIFYEKAKDLIDKSDKLFLEYVKEKDERENKTLKIILSSFILPKIWCYTEEFKNMHKELNLSFDFLARKESFNSLINNNYDIYMSSLEDEEQMPLGLEFKELIRYKPLLVLYKGHKLENKLSDKITKEDIIDNNFVFNNKSISMKSLDKFIVENNIKTYFDFGNYNANAIKTLIKEKMCIWILFDIFLNNEDKEIFIFKDIKNFFPDGSYGCFIKKNSCQKKIVEEFLEFLESKKSQIFADKLIL